MKRWSPSLVLFLVLSACDRGGAGAARRTEEPRAFEKTLTGSRALCDARAPAQASGVLAGKKSVGVRPASSDAWVELGRAWVTLARTTADPGFYLNASACADVALELAPDAASGLVLRGLAYLNDHRFREARDTGERILARDPDHPVAWGIVADSLLELGELEGAEHAVQRMLDLRPDLPSYSRAAHLRWLRGDVRGARSVSERAIQAGLSSHDPEPVAWVLTETALLFWHGGDYAGAGAGFDAALARVRDYPPALVGKARVAMAQRDPASAIPLLERALERNPAVETAWLLGDARALTGDERGAEAAYGRVVADGRRHDRRTLSLFYSAKRREPAEAVRLADAELRDRPSLQTKDALAWALHRAGRGQQARAITDEIARIGLPPDARLLFHAGAIRIDTGDRRSGLGLVRRALAQNPAFDPFEAKEAEALAAGTGT